MKSDSPLSASPAEDAGPTPDNAERIAGFNPERLRRAEAQADAGDVMLLEEFARTLAYPLIVRDLRECIELLKIGLSEGWEHGAMSNAEAMVERYATATWDEPRATPPSSPAGPPMSGLSCPECSTEMVSEVGGSRRCPECNTTVTPARPPASGPTPTPTENTRMQYIGPDWREALERNVTVSLEFAEHALKDDAPVTEHALAFVEDALTECRRLLSITPDEDEGGYIMVPRAEYEAFHDYWRQGGTAVPSSSSLGAATADDAPASIALTVRGLRSLTEHFARIVEARRGGVLISREMAYAIQIELQDKLAGGSPTGEPGEEQPHHD